MPDTPNALTIAAMEESERMSHDLTTKAHSSVSELMHDCEKPWELSDLDTISLALLSPEDKARFNAEIAKAKDSLVKAELDHDSDFISDVVERIELSIALSPTRREFFTRRCANPAKTLAQIKALHDDLLSKENAKFSATAILN